MTHGLSKTHGHDIQLMGKVMSAKQSCRPGAEGQVFPLSDVPDELLDEVLSHLPGCHLVTSCCFVCKKWNQLIQGQGLWKKKCLREKRFIPHCSHILDFKRIYFLNPYGRNLIKNPDAARGFADWKVVQNGGNQFTSEKEAVGTNSITDYALVDGPVPCWVTSYGYCKKTQLLNLLTSGCGPNILDDLQPDIQVSEWYAGRFDCGFQYNLNVCLLAEDKSTVLEEFDFNDTKPAGRDWFQVSHVFKQYGSGLRYIQYTHGGKDTQFWAGHYGVKITLSMLKFDFSEKS